MNYDQVRQLFFTTKECCFNDEMVLVYTYYKLDGSTIECQKWHMPDGSILDTDPGVFCGCNSAGTAQTLFANHDHFRMPDDGTSVTFPAGTIHSISITGDFSNRFEYTVSMGGDVHTYSHNNQFPALSAVGDGSFINEEIIVTLISGSVTVHSLTV